AEPHRTSMVYLERCQGDSPLLLNLQVGSRIAIHISATGWAYLAVLEETRRAPLLEHIKAKTGRDWPRYEARMNEAFEEYARQGFIVNMGWQTPAVAATATPVVSQDGRTIM